MGENMANIYFAAIKVDGCDQPIFVAAIIENNPVIQFINRRKRRSQFGKAAKFCFFHDFEPAEQGCSAVGMFLPKLDQSFSRNDMHKVIFSQFEMKRNPK